MNEVEINSVRDTPEFHYSIEVSRDDRLQQNLTTDTYNNHCMPDYISYLIPNLRYFLRTALRDLDLSRRPLPRLESDPLLELLDL